jgi:hypothetical protein
MNDGFERMWKEEAVIYFKVRSRQLAWRYWGKQRNHLVRQNDVPTIQARGVTA